jgi:hypothetical protein
VKTAVLVSGAASWASIFLGEFDEGGLLRSQCVVALFAS